MRQENEPIGREKDSLPTGEETLQEVSYGKVFSKLDLNMTFSSIRLNCTQTLGILTPFLRPMACGYIYIYICAFFLA